MVSMSVFHAISTEMVVGAFAIATLGTIICSIAALVPAFGERLPSKVHSHLDSAAYIASIFGVLMILLHLIIIKHSLIHF